MCISNNTQGQILVRLIEVFAMPALLTLFILNNCISYFQNILPIPVVLRYSLLQQETGVPGEDLWCLVEAKQMQSLQNHP
jgi:hypothetical protein